MTAGECLMSTRGGVGYGGRPTSCGWSSGYRATPAVIEHLEGAARPASRTRRLPEKSIPSELLLDPEAQAAQTEALRAEWIARQLC
jgi:hypothetical protein